MKKKKIKLGSIVKDPISGLVGIAVSRTVWVWGCTRIAVQPQEIKDGKPVEESWFDEVRLEVISNVPVELEVLNTGGPARSGEESSYSRKG